MWKKNKHIINFIIRKFPDSSLAALKTRQIRIKEVNGFEKNKIKKQKNQRGIKKKTRLKCRDAIYFLKVLDPSAK